MIKLAFIFFSLAFSALAVPPNGPGFLNPAFSKTATAAGPAGQSYLSGAELDGLTAYYRMDAASGADEPEASGPQPLYNLFASNVVSQVGSVSGVITNARLTSTSAKAFFANANGVFNADGHDWTWIMWLKQTNATGLQFFNCKYSGSSSDSQYATYVFSGQISFVTYGNHEECGTVYTESGVSSPTTISLNTWYYVAFGMQSGEMFISVNGEDKTTTVPTDAMQAGASPRLTIGAYADGGANNFHGAIDECIYYSATALDIEQIISIYNGGLGKTIAPP